MQQVLIEPVTQGNPFLFVSLDRSLNDLVNQIIPGGNQLVFPAGMTSIERLAFRLDGMVLVIGKAAMQGISIGEEVKGF